MDGDSLGTINISPNKRAKSLHQFSQQVRGVVEDEKIAGRTVYAGGDDVMALLPAETALDAASKLMKKYQQAFNNNPAATISAAIVYAHWRYPLRQVLRTGHHLLDDVAKDRTGRDSIAMGIIMGSGLGAVWSVPWAVLRGEAQTGAGDPCVALSEILEQFSDDDRDRDESDNPRFNASYLYLLRQRFGRLFHQPLEEPGMFGQLHSEGDVTPDLLRDLAHAEYRRRMKKKLRAEVPRQQTQPVVDQLMSLSRRWKRMKANDDADGKGDEFTIQCDRHSFSFDGWRVARFLKQVHDGKVGDHD
jgi:CRISPR-associated protein Cmr2